MATSRKPYERTSSHRTIADDELRLLNSSHEMQSLHSAQGTSTQPDAAAHHQPETAQLTVGPPKTAPFLDRVASALRTYWVLELCSVSFSVGVLIAQALILHHKMGDRSLMINSSKTGCLATSPSTASSHCYRPLLKRPWGIAGGVKLVFPGIRPQIAYVGAVILVLTLLFDTFNQQVVGTRAAYQEVLRMPNISAATVNMDYTMERSLDTFTAPLAATAAMYASIFDPSSITFPAAQCETGNCTWPISPTLSHFTSTWDSSGNPVLMAQEMYPGLPALSVFAYYESSTYNESDVVYITRFLVLDSSGRNATSALAYTCGVWMCVQTINHTVELAAQAETVGFSFSHTDYNLRANPNQVWFNFTSLPESLIVPETVGTLTGNGVSSKTGNFSVLNYTTTGLFRSLGLLNTTVTYSADGQYSYSSDVARAL
ncbi:hypothetical protein BAUCODRAFT_129986 [Baudoinia panamericana UAMH 10762]|uniref:Uncharacterized protein n=1 Tax=Baudoinia panamericana (strain UAMH 10762) TaxID=717646 RepID=M2N2U3_BAUPA|nr:uncharacterized protein BAUCODRAFT_129986 [Baudoinia panamericana UAMH 10762]EMC98273.1 hypothetical protein BAUCODRAFT_129986 [Baudoinia panamericana UAMH 10762]